VTFVRGFNDAPILTAPAIVSGTTGEVINLSGANAFSIADADIGSQPLRIDLSVASGLLSINLAGAAALVTPNGGSNLGIVGTLGDINATLATLVYTAGSQAGSSAITVRVDDHAAIGGGGNLLANGDAELSVGAFAGGWSGSSIRASDYGIGFGRFGDLDNADALAIGGGSKFFYATGTTSQSAVQTIDVSLYAAAIDAGSIAADLSGYLGGKGAEDDSMSMTAHFVSGQGVELGSATIGPVTAADRGGISQLLFRSAASAVPAGTRSIQVEMHSYVASGTSDAYADNLALYLNNVVSTVIPVELVPANVAPVGLDDTTAADEDQTIAGNLLANDSDGNGDTLRVSNISGVAGSAVVTQGSSAVLKGMWGTLAVNADGSYSYSADADDTDVQPAGTPLYDTFTYTVSDGNGGADTATLTVTVTPLSDIAVQTGTNKADVLNGDWARAGIDDTIHGGSGNDQIDGKAGADFLYGGVGDDQIWGGEGIDRLFGEAGNDMLSGGLGNDRLYGDVGDDRLYGDAGDDILVGGQGNDWLAGGAGADTYVFLSGKSKAAEQDRILGFDLADDQLNLQGVTITGVSQSAGSTVLALSSGAFVTLDGISVANWMAYGADNVTYDLIV
jgi:VCBS repeat-containing protein